MRKLHLHTLLFAAIVAATGVCFGQEADETAPIKMPQRETESLFEQVRHGGIIALIGYAAFDYRYLSLNLSMRDAPKSVLIASNCCSVWDLPHKNIRMVR